MPRRLRGHGHPRGARPRYRGSRRLPSGSNGHGSIEVATYDYVDTAGKLLIRRCGTSRSGFANDDRMAVAAGRGTSTGCPECSTGSPRWPTMRACSWSKARRTRTGCGASSSPRRPARWAPGSGVRSTPTSSAPPGDRGGRAPRQRPARPGARRGRRAELRRQRPDRSARHAARPPPVQEKHGDDVSDWLDAGHSADELRRAVAGARAGPRPR